MPFLYDMNISILADKLESSKCAAPISDLTAYADDILGYTMWPKYYSFSEMTGVLKEIYMDKDYCLNDRNNAYVSFDYVLEYTCPIERICVDQEGNQLQYVSKIAENIDDTMRIIKNDKLLDEYLDSICCGWE